MTSMAFFDPFLVVLVGPHSPVSVNFQLVMSGTVRDTFWCELLLCPVSMMSLFARIQHCDASV